MLETDPKSKQEVEELVDNINHAHNQFIRYDGHSPMQHVLGRDVYIPGMNTCDSRDDQLMSALEVGESRYERVKGSGWLLGRLSWRLRARQRSKEQSSQN